MAPNEATRASDSSDITIERKIPLWGLLCAAGAVLAQGLLLWNGQSLQAAETRHQSEQITELVTQVKAMAAQMNAKDGVDLEQNLRISELSRRVTALETQKENRR